MAEINVTGLAATDPIPGLYEEVNFAAGSANAGTSSKQAILLGNKLSTGSATVETVYGPSDFSTEADVIGLFGSGSELHMQWVRFVFVNKVTPLYMIAVAESAGAQATGTITITGTASANGAIRVWVGDRSLDVSVTSGDLQNAIATNIAAAVNTQSKWPVTASVATNVVTITARQKGPRGNSLRISAQAIGSFTTTVSPTIPTALTGGTTADVATNALAAITAKRFYYQALAFEDATNIGLVVTQATANAAPTIGIRQRVFAGANDTTGSSAITLATGVNMNAVRAELVWQADSDLTPAEIAAHMAGIYALYEAQPRPRLNFNFYGDASSESWAIRAPRKGTAPTRPQILAALQNGVTPIASRSNGSAYLVKRITSRSLNGATQDYRIRDSHKVTVMDNYADDLAAKVAPLLVDAAIGDDPGPNDLPAPGVVTPRQIKAAASQLVGVYDDNGLVQNAAVIKASIVVQRSLVARTRMTGRIPIQTIDVLDQVGLELDQVA